MREKWAAFRDQHPAVGADMARRWAAVRPYLPPVNFITMHHAYFIVVGLVAAAIFWGCSAGDDDDGGGISFVDSLFLVQSAFTTSGLNTRNISALTTAQQAILAAMMVLGSPVLVSLFTIWFRTRIFEKRFDAIVQRERSRKMQATGTVVGMAGAMFGLPVMSSFRHHHHHHHRRKRSRGGGGGGGGGAPPPARAGTTWRHNTRAEADAFQLSSTPASPPRAAAPPTMQPIQEVDRLRPSIAIDDDMDERPDTAYTTQQQQQQQQQQLDDSSFDFSTFVRANKRSIGRNGQFFDLTDAQREYLGGVEYRALKVLLAVVGAYFVVLQAAGALVLGAWLAAKSDDGSSEQSKSSGWWTGVFLGVSSFNNVGMTLQDAGMAAHADDALVLALVTALALAGNYAFPACIRGAVWCVGAVLRRRARARSGAKYGVWSEAVDFILRYPRRLYMMMFPARANAVFVAVVATFAAVNWALLLLLSVGNAVLDVYPVAKRVGLALFQSLTIPSCGYTVVSASSLYFDVQVLWLIMMYVSAYPEIIVMRNSNVYEERSLGIYTSQPSNDSDSDSDRASSTANDDDDNNNNNHHQLLSAVLPTVSASGVSHAASARSVKKLAAVGRRGTAFVGRQVQRRINNFQGVGVTPQLPPPRKLQRSAEIIFDEHDAATNKNKQDAEEEGQVSLVAQHLRSQLSHDIWFIASALLVVTVIETAHSLRDAAAYSVFNFLFEIVSGYTNIGLSIGLPGAAFSFSGGWFAGSKLVMVAMMVRGRHRGLPVALDHSVKLPGWDNARKQDEDADIRRSLSRTSSNNNNRLSVDAKP